MIFALLGGIVAVLVIMAWVKVMRARGAFDGGTYTQAQSAAMGAGQMPGGLLLSTRSLFTDGAEPRWTSLSVMKEGARLMPDAPATARLTATQPDYAALLPTGDLDLLAQRQVELEEVEQVFSVQEFASDRPTAIRLGGSGEAEDAKIEDVRRAIVDASKKAKVGVSLLVPVKDQPGTFYDLRYPEFTEEMRLVTEDLVLLVGRFLNGQLKVDGVDPAELAALNELGAQVAPTLNALTKALGTVQFPDSAAYVLSELSAYAKLAPAPTTSQVLEVIGTYDRIRITARDGAQPADLPAPILGFILARASFDAMMVNFGFEQPV